MRIGCVLTWHQWLLGRISNCAGITDLAKDHTMASALRFARNLTYNEYASRDNEYFCRVKSRNICYQWDRVFLDCFIRAKGQTLTFLT